MSGDAPPTDYGRVMTTGVHEGRRLAGRSHSPRAPFHTGCVGATLKVGRLVPIR